LIDELIPGSATMIDEIIVGFKDAVGEPVIAEKLPDVFDWVEFGAFRRQGDDGDVWWYDEAR
jgi:hypothetical protein